MRGKKSIHDAACTVGLILLSIAPAIAGITRSLSPLQVPHLYLISIGVDNYADPRIPSLHYAVHDAQRVSHSFQLLEPRAEIVNNITILDKSATKTKILEVAADYAARLEDDDMLVIYWSGHGTSDPVNSDVYLIPTDVQYNLLGDRSFGDLAISVKHDLAPLAGERHKVLLLADSSRIGAGLLGDIALRNPGFAILSASKNDETTVEGRQFDGSPFAQEITRALAAPIPDLDGDGLISVDEFYIYLYPHALSNGHIRIHHCSARSPTGCFSLRHVRPATSSRSTALC